MAEVILWIKWDVLNTLDDEDKFRFSFAVVKLTGQNISLPETVY